MLNSLGFYPETKKINTSQEMFAFRKNTFYFVPHLEPIIQKTGVRNEKPDPPLADTTAIP